MLNKKKKLNEEAILKRLSNGEMYQVKGGKSSSFTNESLQPALDNCLAGCGCGSQTACNICQAAL